MKMFIMSTLVGLALGLLNGCAGSNDAIDRTGQHCE